MNMIHNMGMSDATLYDLRTASGLSCREIITEMARHLQSAPTEPTTVIHWEYKGCNNVDLLEAYGKVIGKSLAAMIEANRNTKERGRPRPGKGRPKKVASSMNLVS